MFDLDVDLTAVVTLIIGAVTVIAFYLAMLFAPDEGDKP